MFYIKQLLTNNLIAIGCCIMTKLKYIVFLKILIYDDVLEHGWLKYNQAEPHFFWECL